MFDRLLAKSLPDPTESPPGDSVYLPGHLCDAVVAAKRVLAATADDQLRALGLSPDAYRDRLTRCVLLAAAVHDIGKANDHFQGMIHRKRNVRENPQGLRHEWASLLLLDQLREWLLPAAGSSATDIAIVEWAVAGHHPAHNHESPPRSCPPGAGTEIRWLTGHDDFRAIMDWLATTWKRGPAPDVKNTRRNLIGEDNLFAETAKWAKSAQRLWDSLPADDRRFVAAVKSTLVAADVAGSALPKAWPNDSDRWDWITKSFANQPQPGDLQAIVDYRLNGKTSREFQDSVAASKAPVTFVKAGCGTGKTLAAYMWANANHPARRLYFCYPTTGTATEGFKDYLYPTAEDPEEQGPKADRIRQIGARLFHSRRDIDFDMILSAGRDIPSADADAIARLESLEAWSTPIVSCTVDTVLGLVQNNKRGLFAWPALAQSAFVFDEIHAYDDRLFGALLRFLRDLPGLPVLLMTASLPNARVEALRNVLEQLDRELTTIAGPRDLEERPRYHREAAADNDPLPLVRQTLDTGGKVLWVCNTVKRVMDAADAASSHEPLLYHSRFKYQDRVARHMAVIDAFDPKKSAGRALAICSQVAEMSLDLSADLLVTDLATVPALIQRLGRLNRRAEDDSPTKPFVVIEPGTHLPYSPADLNAARTWLSRLPAAEISQRHLADAWEQTGDQPPELVASAWLDGGPRTTVTELREASPGITVLLDEDFDVVRCTPKDLPRYVIPMPPPPRSLNWRSWGTFRGIPIGPPGCIDYNPLRGAQWQSEK